MSQTIHVNTYIVKKKMKSFITIIPLKMLRKHRVQDRVVERDE